ncbi:LysM peptidoglycan-binding domain-containing protein [Streptomyces sp. NPDC101118]|uniref:LysM peptidoglycan-binding domain-containing protein n=1 Tax=Streptomyces sp. NPDC101118 TaxID=3366109 RepID=UPI003827BFA8
MGIFDFLKPDRKRAHHPADTVKEQVQEQRAATDGPTAGPAGTTTRYAGAGTAKQSASSPTVAPTPGIAMAPEPMAPMPGTAARDTAMTAAPDTAMAPAPDTAMAPAADTAMAPAPDTAMTPAADTAMTTTPAAQPPPAARKRTYTVKPGDSLAAIARTQLGNEARWRELYAMNRGVIGNSPDMIHPGMVLTLPG